MNMNVDDSILQEALKIARIIKSPKDNRIIYCGVPSTILCSLNINSTLCSFVHVSTYNVVLQNSTDHPRDQDILHT
mgnify:CR=1 FL=1